MLFGATLAGWQYKRSREKPYSYRQCLLIRLPQPLFEVVSPALGKSRKPRREDQHFLIFRVCGVEPYDVGEAGACPGTSVRVKRIARRDFAFACDGEIEPRAPAAEEPLDDVRASEADGELEAGHARLGDGEFRRADTQAVADGELFGQSFGRKIFTEGAPRKLHPAKLVAPVVVVLGGVDVHGLVGPSVNGEVGLPVALDVERRDAHRAAPAILPDGSGRRLPVPDDLPGKAGVDRDELHCHVRFIVARYSSTLHRLTEYE